MMIEPGHRITPCTTLQDPEVLEIREDGAVVGRTPLLVPAVGEDLVLELSPKEPQAEPFQLRLSEADARERQGRRVAQHMVAADLVLDAPPEHPRLHCEALSHPLRQLGVPAAC